MTDNSQSRKWQITINNPETKGYTHEVIKEKLKEFKSCVYWCMADETGEAGTYHTHIYIACSSAVRFSTIRKKFEGGHFEMANGTSQQNRDYVYKEGKWVKDKKAETNHKETQEEFGEMPVERQGKRNDLDDLFDMIRSGMTDYEIIESSPSYLMNIDKIEKVRQIILTEQFKNYWRNVECTYIFGVTRSGKTRGVMEQYGYENVYRVSNYKNPFDLYRGQPVLLLDEYCSTLYLQEFLEITDGYPLALRARYADKTACYVKVYVVSNIPLEQQYPNVAQENKQQYDAFLARFHKVVHYTKDSVKTYNSVDEYFNRFKEIKIENTPFYEQERMYINDK